MYLSLRQHLYYAVANPNHWGYWWKPGFKIQGHIATNTHLQVLFYYAAEANNVLDNLDSLQGYLKYSLKYPVLFFTPVHPFRSKSSVINYLHKIRSKYRKSIRLNASPKKVKHHLKNFGPNPVSRPVCTLS